MRIVCSYSADMSDAFETRAADPDRGERPITVKAGAEVWLRIMLRELGGATGVVTATLDGAPLELGEHDGLPVAGPLTLDAGEHPVTVTAAYEDDVGTVGERESTTIVRVA